MPNAKDTRWGFPDSLPGPLLTLHSFWFGAVFSLLLCAAPEALANLHWDTLPNRTSGGTGDWDNTTANWNPTANGKNKNRVAWDSSTAIFSGTAGTATIVTPVSATGLDFRATGFTIDGTSTLTLTGGAKVKVVSGGSADISAPIAGTSGLTMSGPGTLTLSGANTFTGGLTVSAGTLRLGVDNVLADTLPINLKGGTLDISGRTETTGTLKLAAASTIDFGASAAAIVFAASNNLTWAGATLTITNYTTGVDSLRFGANASALTSTQLGKFRFADYGNVAGQIDAFGVVTPVPEPAAFAAWAGALALGCTLGRRRRLVFERA
jgi:fibronectin-binding autotransporter adhesin